MTTASNDVTVKPSDKDVTITWPIVQGASSYTVQITKDGEVVCTLTFNAQGQLTGIEFAPSRKDMAPTAEQSTKAMRFTVTGLEAGTDYAYTVSALNATGNILNEYTGTFTTDEITGIEDILTQPADANTIQKVMIDGTLYIRRDGTLYTTDGKRVY